MKTLKAWFGTDSYGRHIEVALREDGEYFSRAFEYNGYGNSWSKWQPFVPTFETHGTNAYSGERFEYSEPKMAWGFNLLTEYSETPRFRLPKEVA